MMIDNFLIEIKKDNFFKSRIYNIEIDGVNQGDLSFLNSKKFVSLEKGNHSVKIKCDDYLYEDEINVKNDKLQRFYIKPKTSIELLKGVVRGFWTLAIVIFIYGYFILDMKINFSILVIILSTSLLSVFKKMEIKNFLIHK